MCPGRLAMTQARWGVVPLDRDLGSTSTGIGSRHGGPPIGDSRAIADGSGWFVSVDWASETHQVAVFDARGTVIGERAFPHGGGLGALCDWVLAMTGSPAAAIAVAIEVPHGPVVETLPERGFLVPAINPKQLDRFRDRFTVAGAKDDRLDSRVLGDSLRTDRHCFRPVRPATHEIPDSSLAGAPDPPHRCRRNAAHLAPDAHLGRRRHDRGRGSWTRSAPNSPVPRRPSRGNAKSSAT